MNEKSAHAIDWQARLLCRRYLFVCLERHGLRLREGDGWCLVAVRWALGALPDGQLELLGVWLSAESGNRAWQPIFEDLQNRGVERIRFFLNADAAELGVAFPQAVLLGRVAEPMNQKSSEFGRPSAAGVPAALQEPWRSHWARDLPNQGAASDASEIRLSQIGALVEKAALQIRSQIGRAVCRRGGFADREAAVSFFVRGLQRQEHGLNASLMNTEEGLPRRALSRAANAEVGLPAA